MEGEPIVVASLIDNVNSCKKVLNSKGPENDAQDSDEFIGRDESKVKKTFLKNDDDSSTFETKCRRIERFKFKRSATSPIMVARSPAKHDGTSNDVIKNGTKDQLNSRWKQRPRHVSFDECVHVLTKCSVIEIPLKSSLLESNTSPSCCECAKGILKHGERTSAEKKVTFELDEMLCTAILNHDLSEFERVCQHGKTNFNTKLSNGLTLLHLASIAGSFRIVQFILKHDGRVDERDDLGWTPLHYATLHGQVPCALVLLQAGADISARTADHCTVIELAAHDEMLLLLGRAMNGASNKTTSDQNKETYV